MGVGDRQARFEPQRFQVRGLRLAIPLEHAEGVAKVVVKRGRIGVQPDRLLTVRERLLSLPTIQESLAQIGLRRRKRGIELDGTLKLLDRLVSLFQLAETDPQIVVRDNKVRP